mmetsp:Transcript_27184/g.63497  ORF Transcript_27184/g.63497 Transcript_27184/m.63497 type:complete len:337 (-) Transcript_27184:586-1596(-)
MTSCPRSFLKTLPSPGASRASTPSTCSTPRLKGMNVSFSALNSFGAASAGRLISCARLPSALRTSASPCLTASASPAISSALSPGRLSSVPWWLTTLHLDSSRSFAITLPSPPSSRPIAAVLTVKISRTCPSATTSAASSSSGSTALPKLGLPPSASSTSRVTSLDAVTTSAGLPTSVHSRFDASPPGIGSRSPKKTLQLVLSSRLLKCAPRGPMMFAHALPLGTSMSCRMCPGFVSRVRLTRDPSWLQPSMRRRNSKSPVASSVKTTYASAAPSSSPSAAAGPPGSMGNSCGASAESCEGGGGGAVGGSGLAASKITADGEKSRGAPFSTLTLPW